MKIKDELVFFTVFRSAIYITENSIIRRSAFRCVFLDKLHKICPDKNTFINQLKHELENKS